METPKEGQMPSLTNLASSDPKLRRASLKTLTTYLATPPPTRTSLSPTQSLQIWRALLVALLMHDSKSAVSVQNLTSTLAEQFTIVADIPCPSPSSGNESETTADAELTTFTLAFWETVSREWNGIDSHRVDKVLLLVRMSLRSLFSTIFSSSLHSDSTRLNSQNNIFETWPLSPRERKVPDGLRYHVLDIWVDELERCSQEGFEGSEEEIKGVVKALMGSVEKIAKEGLSKGVKTRAKDVLADARARFGEETVAEE